MNCNILSNLYFTNTRKICRTFLNPMVSKTIHHQADTNLCWAFATATMLRQSLKSFVMKLYIKHKKMYADLDSIRNAMKKLKDVEKKGDKKLGDEKQSDFFHRQLRNELIHLPIPKNPSTDNNQFRSSQAHSVRMAFNRVRQFNSISNLNLNFS